MSERFKGGIAREIRVGYARVLFGKTDIPKEAIVIGLRRTMLGDNIEEHIEYYEEIYKE